MHFNYDGNAESLKKFIKENEHILIESTDRITKKMRERGGGLSNIKLVNKSKELKSYYQLNVEFNTIDSMGANFINSCLEIISKKFKEL